MNRSQQDSSTSTGNNHLESFIPVTRFALIDTLVNEAANNGDRKDLVCFFQVLGQWRHQESQDRLLRLKERYLPFSPDRDTIRVLDYSSQQLEVMKEELIDEITALLERANYNLIDADELNGLLSTHSAYGLELKVDQLEYDEILVYYRGAGEETLVQRNREKLFRKEAYTIPTFRRLFLLLKLKPEARRFKEIMEEKDVSEKKAKRILEKRRDKLPKSNGDSFIYLKLFKNIPQEDLEMMFPNTQVQFKLFDKIKHAGFDAVLPEVYNGNHAHFDHPHPAIDANDPGEAGFSGSLVVVDFPSLEEAQAWADEDPYVAAGVYQRVIVKPFKKVLP